MTASVATLPDRQAPTVADFTLSFNCLGDVPLGSRLDAAAAAGFAEVGLSVRWLRLWLADHHLDELVSAIDASGLRVGELEAIRVMTADQDPLEDVAAEVAAIVRPARLQAIAPYDGDLDDATRRAARVADRFAAWDVEVVLEPLPFTNMRTPADAATIIRRAGRPNLSMCMDVWHLYRNGLDIDDLVAVWPEISTVQVNDGTRVSELPDDLYTDCLKNRRITGAGEFDLVGLLRARASYRPDATFSVEVINDRLRGDDPFAAAAEVAAGLQAVIDAARLPA